MTSGPRSRPMPRRPSSPWSRPSSSGSPPSKPGSTGTPRTPRSRPPPSRSTSSGSRPGPTSRKRRGGQPGHERHTRELVPAERLTGSVEIRPPACTGCGHALDGDDPEPIRHQVAELPEIRPEVIEYRLHRLTCPGCGAATRAKLPGDVPRGAFGPRLQAWAGLLERGLSPEQAAGPAALRRPAGPLDLHRHGRQAPAPGRRGPGRPDGRDRPGRPPGRGGPCRRDRLARGAARRPGSGSGRPPGRPPSGCIARGAMTPWKACWARTRVATR